MEDTIQHYKELKPKLERLKDNILYYIDQNIKPDIPIFDIESRIKDEKSIIDKIDRKHEPMVSLSSIHDLCGIRIICYYKNDIDIICDMLKTNFVIISEDNKSNSLKDDQFGYSSTHLIVKLKDEWLTHPMAKDLNDLEAEIQVRTMLMHSWAAISHKLLYKKKDDAPSEIKRKLNRLSALIELADEQFDIIKSLKADYTDKISSDSNDLESVEVINSDVLIVIKNTYFSDRNYENNDIPDLLKDIRDYNVSPKLLIEYIKQSAKALPDIEKECAKTYNSELPLWNFSGVIRTVLELWNDDYFYDHFLPGFPPDLLIERIREQLKNSK